MEIVGILFLLGLGRAIGKMWDSTVRDFQQSKAKRVKEAEGKAAPNPLPKSRRKAAARRHAAGYWAGEIGHGFPVARTGFHAGWLAHRTATDHHKAIREEARTDHLETRVSFLAGIKEHRKRQAEAQKAIDEAVAAAPKPVRGKKAVKEAAGSAVADLDAKRAERAAGTVPPLPADSVKPPDLGLVRAAARPDDSAWLRPGEKRCEGCGGTGGNADGTDACHDCRGFGSAPPDPDAPEAPPGTICAACGNPGRDGDPVLADPGGPVHRSHAHDQQDSYNAALGRGRAACTVFDTSPSPATNGAAPVATAEITFDQSIAEAGKLIAEQEGKLAVLRASRMGNVVEGLAGAVTDSGSLGRAMDMDESLRAEIAACQRTLDSTLAFREGLIRDHGGLNEAHQSAPVEAADKSFYG